MFIKILFGSLTTKLAINSESKFAWKKSWPFSEHVITKLSTVRWEFGLLNSMQWFRCYCTLPYCVYFPHDVGIRMFCGSLFDLPNMYSFHIGCHQCFAHNTVGCCVVTCRWTRKYESYKHRLYAVGYVNCHFSCLQCHRRYGNLLSLKHLKPLTCGDRVFPVYLGQYHGCWCPGSLRRKDISSHDIEYIEYIGSSLAWGRILSTCVISMWRNDTNENICSFSLWKI